ncbi:MAG: hypothetical protein U1G07_14995 [Verrucomicrobiota bacterium]
MTQKDRRFPNFPRQSLITLLWGSLYLLSPSRLQAGWLELTNAVVFLPRAASALESEAGRMLVEEVEKRSQTSWRIVQEWPAEPIPVISLGTLEGLRTAESRLAEFLKERQAGAREGFYLAVKAATATPVVIIAGNDARGVMFGVGRFLRELRLGRGQARIADSFETASAPKTPLRGHQLGYRPKTNSYDAWDVKQWEQYFRDLIVFGCNAIELIPPRSDDAADSPHFPLPPLRMMIEMSRLADRYGLDVWVWYPAMDKDYGDSATVAAALQEWGEIYRSLPRIDAVFVPGGDPGHTAPQHLLDLLQRQSQNLRAVHPKAQMWVSPQGFTREWFEQFIRLLHATKPTWLNGVVFGPQVRVDLPVLRDALPSQYPIRLYPDITHSRQCQYPVRDWDAAYAMTEGRECINPRPMDEAAIFRATYAPTIGFITYSEGCNDDVNKAVWSALGWDPDVPVLDILRQYSRYFIGDNFTDDFADALLSLERNWRGALSANPDVTRTLQQFQALERAADPRQRHNWRFQQGLFRAYYDAYTQRRLIFENELELEAMERLRRGTTAGTSTAISEAESALDRVRFEGVSADWRQRILELGAELYQSIGMQMSVAKYQAIAVDRGACLDTLDFPLNNRLWLKQQFQRIRQLATETEREQALREIVEWEDPGLGGYYDDLGHPGSQPHLRGRRPVTEDPGFMASPRTGFAGEWDAREDAVSPPFGQRRRSWLDHAESLYDASLQLQYADLDPTARYEVFVVYAGDSPKRRIRLVANETMELHPLMEKPVPFQRLRFAVPAEATATGLLTLTWSGEPGLGGNGRGCQVSEVWLKRK